MITLDSKLYVQLQPNHQGLEYLLQEQQRLDIEESDRLVKPAALHMTVLHIGLISRLLAPLPINPPEALAKCTDLLVGLQNAVQAFEVTQFRLKTALSERFGPTGHTIVVTLEPDEALSELHRRSLVVLRKCIADCGVSNVDSYMQNDPNLRYALTLRPHITLAKNYKGNLPTIKPGYITLSVMPLLY